MNYIDRMTAEHQELNIKIYRLEGFRGLPEYRALALEEQNRLTAQLLFMRGYAEILRQRLAYAAQIDQSVNREISGNRPKTD